MEAETYHHHQEEKLRNMNSSSTAGFCYSAISSGGVNQSSIHTHLMNQIQTSESNPDQMFNMTTNMDMIGYFPPANDDQSSMVVNQQDHLNSWQENHRMLMDDSSLGCVYPGEGNDQRTSQGLSLSLSSINPSSGLESFELRQTGGDTTPTGNQTEDHHHHQMRYLTPSSREAYYGKSLHNIQPEQQMMADELLGKVSTIHVHQHGLHQFQLIRHSKYLKPSQELLNEFCSLESKQTEVHRHQKKALKQKAHRVNQWDQNDHGTSSNAAGSSRKQNLYSLELLELQKRKAQLLSMLEEVDRRYKHYCDQMKAVVSSFEAAAGNGAATVYSALASKAMSRHFRCLRDGIVEQIKATREAMGEKDDQVALGTTRGETPRLRQLDQTLRQQKAFQQLNMMESHPWRSQRGLPERSVSLLRAWLFEHFLHPYPTDVDKHILARQTGLSRSQVSNWFINARVRLWKPMVEEMYMEETKDELDNALTNNNVASNSDDGSMPNNSAMMSHHAAIQYEDEKPTPDQLIRIDSDCLSSIINQNNSQDKNEAATSATGTASRHSHIMHSNSFSPYGAYNQNTGAIQLDFSSYNHSQSFGRGGGGGGGDVSLTLGLQQHGEGGEVILAYPSSGNAGVSSHASLFYSAGRDSLDECQTIQYSSIMDGDQGQNLPYRNLIGAQLLHDMAG